MEDPILTQDGSGAEGTEFDLHKDDNQTTESFSQETDTGNGEASETSDSDVKVYIDEDGNEISKDDLGEDYEILEGEDDPEPETGNSDLQEQIAALTEQNKQLMEIIKNGQTLPTHQQETTDPVAQPTTDGPLVSEEELSKIFDEGDYKVFGDVLQRVQLKAAQTIMGNIPHVLSNMINHQVSQKSMIDSFYQENSDLVPYKEHVALVGQELAKQHPEWDTTKLLGETAKEFRNRFGQTKRVQQPKTNGSNPKRKVVRIVSKKGQPHSAGGKQGGPKKGTAPKDPSEMTKDEIQQKEMESLFVDLAD